MIYFILELISVVFYSWTNRTIRHNEQSYIKKPHLLGKGSFGKVWAGRRLNDQKKVIIKRTRQYLQEYEKDKMPKEAAFLEELKTLEGVTTLVEAWTQMENGRWYNYIITERISGGIDLFQYIHLKGDDGRLEEVAAKHIFKQIVEAIVQCHALGVCHRDLKEENLVIQPQSLKIFLIDFGCACYFQPGYHYDCYIGTLQYLPPEIFVYEKYQLESLTVWSLGILLFSMTTGDVPFNTIEQIKEGELVWKSPITLSHTARNLIRIMLSEDEDTRISLTNILTHTWMTREYTVHHPFECMVDKIFCSSPL